MEIALLIPAGDVECGGTILIHSNDEVRTFLCTEMLDDAAMAHPRGDVECSVNSVIHSRVRACCCRCLAACSSLDANLMAPHARREREGLGDRGTFTW